MPRIPFYTAPGASTPGVGQPNVSAYSGAYALQRAAFEDLEQGIALVTRARNLVQAQKDEADYIAMRGDFANSLDALKINLSRSPEIMAKPENYEKMYTDEAKKIYDHFAKTQVSPRTMQLFRGYANRELGKQLNMAKVDGTVMMEKSERDRLATSFETLTEQYARSTEFEEQMLIKAIWSTHVHNAMQRGFMLEGEAESLNEKFDETAATKQMSAMVLTPAGSLFIEENPKSPMFDKVPIVKRLSLFDKAVHRNAATINKAQQALERARKAWSESIERETEVHIANRTLTLEWLEDYKHELTSEKIASYRRALRDQEIGKGTGDPAVERIMQADVYNPRLNPQETLDRITKLYGVGHVGYDSFSTWAPYLGAEIRRRQGEARTNQNEGETRVRELRGHRYNAALKNLEVAFRTTNMWDDFDASATEAYGQALRELQRTSDYLGGNEDSLEIERRITPKYVAMVQVRTESRLKVLNDLLEYSSAEALKADRGRIGEAAYERQALIMKEIRDLNRELQRLESIRKRPVGAK